MSPELPRAVATGTVDLFGVPVRVSVLDDGRRVIDADSMGALLEIFGEGVEICPADIATLAALIGKP